MMINHSTESAWIQLNDKEEIKPRARKRLSIYWSSVEQKLKIAGVARPDDKDPFDIQEILILQQVMARSHASSLTISVAFFALAMTVLFSISALTLKGDLALTEIFQFVYGLSIAVVTLTMMVLLGKRMRIDRSIEAAAIIMERRLAERVQQELKKSSLEQEDATNASYRRGTGFAGGKCLLIRALLRLIGK